MHIIEMRRIDDLGRVVIPKSIRNELGLEYGDQLIVALRDGVITITPKELPDLACCASCIKWQQTHEDETNCPRKGNKWPEANFVCAAWMEREGWRTELEIEP